MTVEILLKHLQKRHNIRCIAGEFGLSNTVIWYHNLEEIRNIRYINGGEIIILKGSFCDGDEWLSRYVREAIRNKASGVIIYTGRSFPKVPQSIIDECNQLEFPLLALPWTERLVDLTNSIAHKIIGENRKDEMIAVALENAIISPDNVGAFVPTLSGVGYLNTSEVCVLWIGRKDNQPITLFLMDSIKLGELNGERQFSFPFNGGFVVVFFNQTDSERAASAKVFLNALQKIFDGTELYCGISESISGVSNLRKCYRQALCAFYFAQRENKQTLLFHEIGPAALLASIDDFNEMTTFYKRHLGELEKHDAENNTVWVDLLECYLRHNCSVQETADALFVHRNTVNYTLRLIRDVLSIKEMDVFSCTALMLACDIRYLLQTDFFRKISFSTET